MKMPLKKVTNKNGQGEKHAKNNNNNNTTITKVSKTTTGTGSTMKMTIASTPMTPRIHHRKVLRLAGKRPSTHHHRSYNSLSSGKGRQALRPPMDACDNSDDSGLGFDHHMDVRALHYSDRNVWDDVPETKRRKLDVKVEHDDANDGYCFPETVKNCKENNSMIRTIPGSGIQNLGRNASQNVNSNRNISRCLPVIGRRAPITGPITLTSQLSSTARNGKIHLQIMCQPEQQHRARYQTEGSRGAVKDRTGNGFPIVKLIGYDKPATLQIFIGTDLGRVAPHMFYQACRVSGKNSTPCIEKKIDGTIVIEVELEPAKEMIATCDCVGILKERNVDVEHRFPEQLSPRSKKKSTKCRMVFRTAITNDDGSTETLQVCSQPIVCTQPPGVPEICKKSLISSPVTGGVELFILGKNFLKDTKVVFQQALYEPSGERSEILWEEYVVPDKEFLQQTHLVCVVPPYTPQDIQDPVQVRLIVISSGKQSEPHSFQYTPLPPTTTANPSVRMETNVPTPSQAPFLSKMLWQTGTTRPKQEMDLSMMPPPVGLVPLAQRRPSNTNIEISNTSPPLRSLKTELIDENSQGSLMERSVDMVHMIHSDNSMDMRHRFRTINESSLDVHHDDTNLSMINENSIDLLRRQEMIMSENSNSVHSFHCDKSNHSIHEEDSPAEQKFFTINPLMQPELENATLSLNDLKGVDLRMKTTATLNDLANTQPPSLATLRRFVVTEPTNIPLPAQTGQSVENYLTTLENNVSKANILSNTIATSKSDQLLMQSMKTSSLLDGNPILSTQFSNNNQLIQNEQPKLFMSEQNQMLTDTLLTTTTQNIPNLTESQLIANFNQQPTSKPENNLLLTTNLQAAINANILQNANTKLDALVNSTVETHIGSPTKSPQRELTLPTTPQELLRRSPMMNSQPPEILITQSADVLINPQVPMLSAMSPNDMIIRSPHQEMSSNLSPEVILNPQISPNVMCRSPQDTLLQVCQQNVLPQTNETESSLLLKNPTVSVESIVINAAVDLLETQKKISEITGIDNHLLQTSVDQPKSDQIINTFIDVRNTPSSQESNFGPPQALLQPQISDLLLGQNQFVTNTTQSLITEKTNEFLNLDLQAQIKPQESIKAELKTEVTQVTQPTELKKSEENMIPPALTNMSDNDLISYINPSCFDQV